MHGSIAPGVLTPERHSRQSAAVRFELATAAHDAGLRRLCRDNPMKGTISLALEREPNYFRAAAIEGRDNRTIVALKDGKIICAGNVSERQRFINGVATRVGYLGGLRLDAARFLVSCPASQDPTRPY